MYDRDCHSVYLKTNLFLYLLRPIPTDIFKIHSYKEHKVKGQVGYPAEVPSSSFNFRGGSPMFSGHFHTLYNTVEKTPASLRFPQ